MVPFTVDFSGEFGPDDLTIVWRDRPRPPHPELDRMVAETWEAFAAECRKNRQYLFNGPMARLLCCVPRDGGWYLEVGPTDYANYIGTNYLNHHRGERFGWDLFANPLGVSALLVTADDWLVMGRRGRHLAVCPGMLHLFGGALDPADRLPDGRMDAFGCVRRELHEELSLAAQEIVELICTGLVRETTSRQPELIFECKAGCSLESLKSRLRPGHPDEEHSGIEFCRPTEQGICDFVQQTPGIAPVAAASLGQFGRRRFGEEWYNRYLRIF